MTVSVSLTKAKRHVMCASEGMCEIEKMISVTENERQRDEKAKT